MKEYAKKDHSHIVMVFLIFLCIFNSCRHGREIREIKKEMPVEVTK